MAGVSRTLVFGIACLVAGANAHATATRIWGDNNNMGYARQITVALDAGHVFLAEAGLLTVIDRATGAETRVPIRTPDGDYLPVHSAVVHDGALWLSAGNGTRGSRPRLLVVRGTHVEERARLDRIACSLTSSEGEIYFRDDVHIRRVAANGVVTVATAPRGRYFLTDCRFPMPIDHDQIYAVLGTISNVLAATPLVAYPRRGGSPTTLDPDVARQTALLAGRALVLTHSGGAHRPIEGFDLATHARSTLVPSATVVAVAAEGDALVYIDGNFYSHDRWVVRRVTLSSGAISTLHEGDERLGDAIVMDARGIYALVAAHPPGECVTVHHAIEPGDHTIVRCAQPDLQLFSIPAP